MRERIEKRLAGLVELAMSLDAGLWAGRFQSPETRDVAERSKQRLVDRIEQARWILRKRYGVQA